MRLQPVYVFEKPACGGACREAVIAAQARRESAQIPARAPFHYKVAVGRVAVAGHHVCVNTGVEGGLVDGAHNGGHGRDAVGNGVDLQQCDRLGHWRLGMMNASCRKHRA